MRNYRMYYIKLTDYTIRMCVIYNSYWQQNIDIVKYNLFIAGDAFIMLVPIMTTRKKWEKFSICVIAMFKWCIRAYNVREHIKYS